MKRLMLLVALGGWSMASAETRLMSETFEDGMGAWEYAPGTVEMGGVIAAGEERGKILDLHPDKAILGVNSALLMLGEQISRDKAYKVSARIRSAGLQEGVFAFSVCYYDAAGRRLSQMSVHSLSTTSEPHDWLVKSATFGKGTTRPFSADTASMLIRFSFWDRDLKCAGQVMIDDVVVEEVKVKETIYSDWPASILADVGEVQVRLESRSFWTLYRIDYRGKRLCLDIFGSHYGSVGRFSGTGFIGSGHTENEDEQVLELALIVDGTAQISPKAAYTCNELLLTKASRLRDLTLKSQIQVSEGRILEDVVMSAAKPTKLDLIYHFMHPWTTQMSNYLGVQSDGARSAGEFTDDKKMKISKPVKWSAVYSRELQSGAVTAVLAAPEDVRWEVRYWDVPERYRKHYFAAFIGSTVPVNTEYHFRVLTIPFACPFEQWLAEAERLAAEAVVE